MSCHSSLSARSLWFTCDWCGVLSPGWGVIRGWHRFLPPSGVRGWVPDGSPSLAAIKACSWVAEGGDVLSLIGSSQNAIALMTPCTVANISSTGWNNMTNLTPNYLITPLGCVCPNLMQISMMSSSCMEVASKGVPSSLIRTRTHIQLMISTSSLGIQSWVAKAVTVEVVDIVEGKGKFCKGVYGCDLEKSAD